MTHGRADIRELLLVNGLRPSRALGQNFVADANTVRRIVRLAGVEPGRQVVEIGAGLGSLTLALVEGGARVTAVEIDRHVVPVLRSQVEPLGVRVVEADALTLDWNRLLGEGAGGTRGEGPGGTRVEGSGGEDRRGWVLVANLPYNVATSLVISVLEEASAVSSMLVMVQREVGDRMAAGPGEDAYGAVSVKVAYWATAKLVGRVPPSVFIPRPRVESVLVRLDRRPRPELPLAAGTSAPVTYDRLFTVVRAGFAHRRKMLRRSLEGVVDPAAFEAAGVRPTARAEELGLEQWGRLAAASPPTATPSSHPVQA